MAKIIIVIYGYQDDRAKNRQIAQKLNNEFFNDANGFYNRLEDLQKEFGDFSFYRTLPWMLFDRINNGLFTDCEYVASVEVKDFKGEI